MRRLRLRVALIAIIAAVVLVATAIVAGGAERLAVFVPTDGTVEQRLRAVETYLETHSAEVQHEVTRTQRVINVMTAVLPCPTREDLDYLDAFDTAYDEVGAAMVDLAPLFEDIGDDVLTDRAWQAAFRRESRLVTDALDVMANLEAPDTPGGQTLAAATRTMADAITTSLAVVDRGLTQQHEQTVVDGLVQFGETTPLIEAVNAAIPQYCRPENARDATEAVPTDTASHPLVNEFGCQWIMDTYRPMVTAGRDLAIQHVANSMMLKRQNDGRGFGFIGSGDAAVAVRECEATGFS